MVAGVVGVTVVTIVTQIGAQRVNGVGNKNFNYKIFNIKYKIKTYHGKDPKNKRRKTINCYQVSN